MKLTYKLLKAYNACEPEAAVFKEMFPDGCEPTIENLTELAQTKYEGPDGPEFLNILWLEWLLPRNLTLKLDKLLYRTEWFDTEIPFSVVLEARLAILSSLLMSLPNENSD